MSKPLFKPGQHEFRMSGSRFDAMPLERVAEYMKHVAAIAGPTAHFVRMTPTKIVFREGK